MKIVSRELINKNINYQYKIYIGIKKEIIKQIKIITNIDKILNRVAEIAIPYGNQSNFYGANFAHTKETKQNKREFFSFEKKSFKCRASGDPA